MGRGWGGVMSSNMPHPSPPSPPPNPPPSRGRASERRVALAAVAGAHGIQGEVRLKLFAQSAGSLARHKCVFVDGQPMTLRDVRANGKAVIARFDGIADRSEAEALRGKLVEVDRAELPPLEEGEYYHADLIGLPCVDEAGTRLGTVAAIENFGAGDLIELEREGQKRSLIPFRDPIARLEHDRIVLDPGFLA